MKWDMQITKLQTQFNESDFLIIGGVVLKDIYANNKVVELVNGNESKLFLKNGV